MCADLKTTPTNIDGLLGDKTSHSSAASWILFSATARGGIEDEFKFEETH